MSRRRPFARALISFQLLGQLLWGLPPPAFAAAPPASPSLAPAIRHSPIGGVPANAFARIEAVVDSALPLRSAKLYFRASQYEDFYYVEMEQERDRDGLVGFLPIPSADTPAVDYFIEVVDEGFDSIRTGVHRVATTTEPLASAVDENDAPDLTVGKLSASAPDLPPGFQAAGIVGFIGVAGLTASGAAAGGAGAGIGLGTAALAGAGAAGGVAVVAATSGDETSLTACFTLDPALIQVGQAVRLDARCSEPAGAITHYVWDLGDGREREGPTVNPIYDSPGSFTITLTVTGDSGAAETRRTLEVRATTSTSSLPGGGTSTVPTTTVMGGGLTACIETKPDPPTVELGQIINLDGRCSTGDIATYDWQLGDGRTRTGPFINVSYQEPGSYLLTLTVRNGDGSASATANRTVSVNEEVCICHIAIGPGFRTATGAASHLPQQPLIGQTSTTTIVTTTAPPTTTTTVPPMVTETTVCGASEVGPHLGHPDDYPGVCDGRSLPLRAAPSIASLVSGEPARTTTSATTTTFPEPEPAELETSFDSFLEGAGTGAVRGRLAIGEVAAQLSTSGQRRRHAFRSSGARVTIEGTILDSGPQGLRWHFDFSAAKGFVPGSLEVELGNSLAITSSSVVFRLSGQPGERVRFRYLIEAAR